MWTRSTLGNALVAARAGCIIVTVRTAWARSGDTAESGQCRSAFSGLPHVQGCVWLSEQATASFACTPRARNNLTFSDHDIVYSLQSPLCLRLPRSTPRPEGRGGSLHPRSCTRSRKNKRHACRSFFNMDHIQDSRLTIHEFPLDTRSTYVPVSVFTRTMSP